MSRNILVTGVSRGLGLETARAILNAGWTVFGVSRTFSAEFEALTRAFPKRTHFGSYDLRLTESVKDALFKDFISFDVQLHGVVNNAAIAYDDLVTNARADRLSETFSVNVFTPMMICKYAVRNMLLHGTPGSVVHVSSISVHTGYKGLAMYASTKGALEAFSKNAAREWGGRRIRSNCVVAGFMETEMSSTLSGEQRRRIYERTALKQPTDPASVAATIVYLLSDASSSITGQNVFVDSGTI